jgi:hypothetical protein
MGKSAKVYLLIMLAIVVLIVVIDAGRPKPVNWEPTYSLDHKNPLDLYVFNQQAEKLIGRDRLKRITVTPFEYLREDSSMVNMLIINHNEYDMGDSVLLDAVARGSNLFISAENIISYFTDTLNVEYGDVDETMNLQTVDSVHLTLAMKNWSGRPLVLKPVLNSFAFTQLDERTTSILGRELMPDSLAYPNFVRIRLGKGNVFLHNQPQVFTNYALLYRSSSADYVAHLLAYLPKDKQVVWFVKDQTSNTGRPENESSLSVIFRYPALRWAWLLFIYGLLLYILFNAKRRQRIIPVRKPLRNTTVEFVQTIGNLYYQEGSTNNMMNKKIIYFLDKIRRHYYLETTNIDDVFVERLHSKSGKDRELINEIVRRIRDFRKLGTSIPSDLIELNDLMEEFWSANHVETNSVK